MLKKYCAILFSVFYVHHVNASGVSLGATRLIYPTSKEQVTLKIYNTDEQGNYLIQSWVSDKDSVKTKDFIITPPLFIMKSGSDNLLKVIYTGDKSKLPVDKEEIYFLNVKVIPSLTEKEKNIDNALLISTTTKIKMFIRPDKLQSDSNESYKQLRCSFDSGKVKMYNSSPFYINLVSLSVNGKKVSDAETIAPMSSIYLNSSDRNGYLTFNFINDYGVQVKNKQCKL